MTGIPQESQNGSQKHPSLVRKNSNPSMGVIKKSKGGTKKKSKFESSSSCNDSLKPVTQEQSPGNHLNNEEISLEFDSAGPPYACSPPSIHLDKQNLHLLREIFRQYLINPLRNHEYELKHSLAVKSKNNCINKTVSSCGSPNSQNDGHNSSNEEICIEFVSAGQPNQHTPPLNNLQNFVTSSRHFYINLNEQNFALLKEHPLFKKHQTVADSGTDNDISRTLTQEPNALRGEIMDQNLTNSEETHGVPQTFKHHSKTKTLLNNGIARSSMGLIKKTKTPSVSTHVKKKKIKQVPRDQNGQDTFPDGGPPIKNISTSSGLCIAHDKSFTAKTSSTLLTKEKEVCQDASPNAHEAWDRTSSRTNSFKTKSPRKPSQKGIIPINPDQTMPMYQHAPPPSRPYHVSSSPALPWLHEYRQIMQRQKEWEKSQYDEMLQQVREQDSRRIALSHQLEDLICSKYSD